MLQKLASHNDDIKRLLEKGYALAFDNNFLIVRDIPYLDKDLQEKWGAIVTKLVFKDNDHVGQENHQIFFAGGTPYNLDGKPVPNLGNSNASLVLGNASKDVVVERVFSNKHKVDGQLKDYRDFFDKIENYMTLISGPAIAKGANPFTFRATEPAPEDSVFKFRDTLTSRAEITDLAQKFKNDVVAIIGAGGTGGYILDFLVKTPVREIRVFDPDPFYIHNAFRSPGRLDQNELHKTKAEMYQARYDNFRTGLHCAPKLIDTTSASDLEGVTFAFVCVDKGSSRSGIFDLLLAKKIPFIDVGMGLKRTGVGPIRGDLRVTHYSAETGQKVRERDLAPLIDGSDDIYRTNIQISELNALNACLAVIKFKQLRGFYIEEAPLYHLLMGVGDLKVVGE